MVDLDIDKICRVCLQPEPEVSLLFDEQNAVNGVCLSDMISECTMYTVRRYDGFPDLICCECMERVRIAYEFKKQFEASHRVLIRILESLNKFVSQSDGIEANHKCTQTDDTSLYPCEKCDEKFISYERLREHRSVVHKGTANVCRLCLKTFNRIADLKNHIAVCHPESGLVTPNECSVCKKKFIRKDHVLRHMRMVHKVAPDAAETKGSNEIKGGSNDILEETEIDLVQEADCDVLSTSDPVDGLEIKDESCTGLNVQPKEEIISDYAAVEEDENGSVGDTFGANNFSSDEDEKPLSRLRITHAAGVEDHKQLPEANSPAVKNELTDTSNIADLDDTNSPEKKTSASAPAPEHHIDPSSNRRFKCSQCDKVFTRSNHVKRHLLSHNQEKPFSCHICNKRFSRADHLKIHLTNHNSTKPYKCYVCDRSFSRSDLLNRHSKQMHEKDKMARSEMCKLCNRSFSSKYYLQKHMRLHMEKNWKCKFCEIEFDSKDALKEHTKSHSTEKPFLCSECGQCFIRKDYLLIHMRRHNGEKPYKCKYCEKGFPRATDLKVHERYHTGEKTHLCTICGKGFQRGYNLEVHMRVHTRERPYQCPHCPKKFSQGNDLKVHVRRHTGERFKCKICGTEFMQAFNLTHHKLTVHGIEDKSRKGRVAKVNSEGLSQKLASDAESQTFDEIKS